MKDNILIMIFSFIFSNTLLLANHSSSYALDEKAKSILILNSYHKGFPWTDNIVKGVESVYNPDSNNVKFIVEYMDTKAMGFGEEYKLKLHEFLSYKYQQHDFDLIISSDDNAFNFLREYHEVLFPGVPIVVCGVNNRNAPNLVDPGKFTGVLESTSHEETIELILNLHPETEKIFLVIDSTPSGEYRWKVTKPSFDRYKGIEFIRISDEYSMTEIEDMVSGLKSDSVVIFFTLYRDKSGKYLTLEESVTRLTTASSRPVYTTHLLELPYGVVGGKVLGGFHHGEIIANIAMRILNGEDIRNIPFLLKSPTQYVFDYSQLKKWNIKHADLPEDSIILNEPFSIYEEYKFYIFSFIAIFIILLFIIFYLQLNILKRKKAERAQLESERKYRALFENERNAILIFAPRTMSIIDVNPSVSVLYGYSHDELIGMNCLKLSAEVDKSIDTFSKSIKEGNANVKLRWHKKKDGTVFPVALDSYAVDVMGKAQGYAVIRDITEQKELESKLIQSQKMESIGTLAGGIAHDFNNILGAILGYAEMAQEGSPAGSMVRKDIDQVVKASHRAKDLVKQILSFSRQAETDYIPLQPDVIIKEALKMLRSSLPTTIDIQQDIDSETRPILADPTQIHQIINNLCTNAFHAMEETGGTLTISLKNKTLTVVDLVSEPHVEPGHFVEIIVGDTGPGIALENIDKIFDPFFTTKEVGKGTGMGLAIIHGIAKKSGGFVSCKSSPGQGATFIVYLPVHTVPASPEAETTPLELTQGGIERILFIDDEEMLVEMGKTMLERLGYRVTVETNSIEALKTIQSQPDRFDLVITDQTMPGMTGSDLARRILQIRPKLPIILCTGFSNQISEEKARIYGIKGFAMKPLAIKDLATLVRKVLDGEKPKEQ